MKHIALLLPACLALTACVGSGNDVVPQAQQGFNDAMKPRNQFSCQNGLAIAVNSLDTERVELSLDDQRAVLQIAVAASGERYTSSQGLFGNATEWHQKGGEGILEFVDPYGNRVETVCHSR